MKFTVKKMRGLTMTQKEWEKQSRQSLAIAQGLLKAHATLFPDSKDITTDDQKFLIKVLKRKRKTGKS